MLGDDGPVHPTPVARELAEVILRPTLGPLGRLVPVAGEIARPLLGAIPASLYAWTLWPAVGLLPERVRAEYGFRFGPLERAVSAWLVAGWRAWRPLIPPRWRWMAQARAAERRTTARPAAQ